MWSKSSATKRTSSGLEAALGKRWRLLFSGWGPVILFEGVVLYLSSRPYLQLPARIPHLDKAAHFVEYAVLGALLFRAARLSDRRTGMAFLVAIFLASGLGSLDELFQRLIPGRCCAWTDWLADSLGAGLGASVAILVERWLPPRVWALWAGQSGPETKEVNA